MGTKDKQWSKQRGQKDKQWSKQRGQKDKHWSKERGQKDKQWSKKGDKKTNNGRKKGGKKTNNGQPITTKQRAASLDVMTFVRNLWKICGILLVLLISSINKTDTTI